MSDPSGYRYKKPEIESNGDEFAFHDEYLESQCPALFDLMSRQCADGQAVKPVSMSVFAQEGRLTVCLNWDCEGLILFVACGTSETMFDDLETKLKQEKPGWRKKRAKFQPRT